MKEMKTLSASHRRSERTATALSYLEDFLDMYLLPPCNCEADPYIVIIVT